MVLFRCYYGDFMTSITLKNIDEPLFERIKQQATNNKRSINRQILWLLEQVTTTHTLDPATLALQQRETQLAAWRKLSGQWLDSETDTSALITDIYQSRTTGREFSL